MDQPDRAGLTTPPRVWPWIGVGILCIVLGPLLLWGQMTWHRMGMPWYIPGLASVGVCAMLVAAYRRRSLLPRIAASLALLLCLFEWYALAIGTRTPEYVGPLALNQPFPAFATELVTGESFSQRNLGQGKPQLLIFFRGRW